ncbi:MAG: YggS family pyridoxal phosphate-dependent enzyme [Flammeovirgaceae bacterium]|nr:MAG: YggS family pyridoxal phosphate-dependent enzyme [Flammeovirgaceae bacterium]
MSDKNNIRELQATLPANVKLIAVSKTHPPDRVLEVYRLGQRCFGENKVQELVPKYQALPKDIEWHMIGHLQTNKVKYIAPFVSLIHSVDSLKLLQEINKQAERCNRIIPVLLQIHIASEETKFGLSADEAEGLIKDFNIKNLNHIKITGLMGMATYTDDTSTIRKEFSGLKTLFEKFKAYTLSGRIEMTELSMGMSHDFRIALEEGSTMVRIGSAIFGAREA